MKILVAEDDENILNGFCEILESEGYKIFKAKNGYEALQLYKSERPDFLCLDVMMPEVSGFDVCREVRKSDPDIPIIFLTARSQEIDKVLGLELGADDYIVKPFGVHEVVARIRAVTRRLISFPDRRYKNDSFIMGDLEVFPSQLRACRNDVEIDLSLREVKILQLLFEHRSMAVDRDMLLDHCWGAHIMPESRTVDQHIASLRKKIETDPQKPQIIKTVHGAGYRYE